MSIYEHKVETIDGNLVPLEEYRDMAVLIVNVASKCGLTPQYAGLQHLQDTYGARGFTVLGFPCNQFGGQEPGTHGEIKQFCETSFGVTFPLFAKIDVNGEARHPLYEELTKVADAEGKSGDIRWNFEKFLVAPGGAVTRFSPLVTPDAEALVAGIEAALA
jgi:glutathione peroxidase